MTGHGTCWQMAAQWQRLLFPGCWANLSITLWSWHHCPGVSSCASPGLLSPISHGSCLDKRNKTSLPQHRHQLCRAKGASNSFAHLFCPSYCFFAKLDDDFLVEKSALHTALWCLKDHAAATLYRSWDIRDQENALSPQFWKLLNSSSCIREARLLKGDSIFY